MTTTHDLTGGELAGQFTSAEGQVALAIEELLNDAQTHLVAGEYGMLIDSIDAARRLLAGGTDNLPRYDVVAQFETNDGVHTVHCLVIAPIRNVALMQARAQVIERYHLADDAHVRTMIDCVEVAGE